MSKSDPEVPDALHNRAADNWRPLLAVADGAGGPWPMAREVAHAAVAANNEQSTKVMLLGDIRAAFRAKGADRLATEELTDFLVGLEDRPWAEWRSGRPLSKASLSRMLGQFGILSGTIRLSSGKTPKGYYASAFQDAFVRYLPAESATPPQASGHGHYGHFQSASAIDTVASSKTPQTNNHRHCGGVAFSNPFPGQKGARPMSNGAHGRIVPPDDRRPALGLDGASLGDFS